VRHLEFHTPYLRPAPTFRSNTDPTFLSTTGLSAAVLANRARRPLRGLTEDWIRQHTAGETNAEGVHWLSDGESENSSLSNSLSGDFFLDRDNFLEQDNLLEQDNFLDQDNDPRTPTLRNYRRERANTVFDFVPRPRGHRRTRTTETVTQADFLETLDPRPLKMTEAEGNPVVPPKDEQSAAASAAPPAEPSPEVEKPLPPTEPSPAVEKPLPPPPPNEAPADASEWKAAALPNNSTSVPKEHESKPETVPEAPRLKKKVPWKGNKNIMVLLPWHDDRGKPGKAPKPMKKSEVEAMMRDWNQLGYNVRGFDLGYEQGLYGEVPGQSRAVWPNAEALSKERQEEKYHVSIPDRREWDRYVQELSEAKLRALGVSFGDDEPAPTASPVPKMVRQVSTQFPQLPFSPPLPTSSVASSHVAQQVNTFSPAFMPNASTSQSSNVASMASPTIQAHLQAKIQGKSPLPMSDSSFASPFQLAQQMSPAWSPQQMLYQNSQSRGGSPALQNLIPISSPNTPFPQDGYFAQQFMGQAPPRKSPRLQEVLTAEDLEAEAARIAAANPPYRGHNASDSLQKEIDDAEYHLEEQFQRQLEHEDYSPHSEGSNRGLDAMADHPFQGNGTGLGLSASRYAEEGPVLHHPQPHSRGHSLSQQPFDDRDELTPSPGHPLFTNRNPPMGDTAKNPLSHVSGNAPLPYKINDLSHERTFSTMGNPWQDAQSASSRPSHRSRPSLSKLNVGAKEFKFDPSSSFTSSQFSFNGNSFQPNIAAHATFSPAASLTMAGHPANNAFGFSGFGGNVGAMPFVPGQSEFSFSTSGPSFRPDAPVFNPSASVGSNSSTGMNTSLFGKIDMNLANMVKQPKKSKAIPIIRPDSTAHPDEDKDDDGLVEDKDGRITQDENRIKRSRGAGKGGDEVPQFAIPIMPLSETKREQSPPKEAPIVFTEADKENSTPLSQDGTPQASPKPATRPRSMLEESPDYDGKGWAPEELEQQNIVEDLKPKRSLTFQPYDPLKDGYTPPGVEEAKVTTPKKHKKNSLSATAKPFEFRPGGFALGTEAPASKPVATLTLPMRGGLAGSRYATASPPARQRMGSPDSQASQHENSALEKSLLQPDSPTSSDTEAETERDEEILKSEPTFEEIDEVMRHMTAEEIKLAAAAHQPQSPTWHQPSPIRSIKLQNVLEPSPVRLPHRHILRSDAPSPSPRRHAAMPGETLISSAFRADSEDPFMEGSPAGFPMSSPAYRLNQAGSVPPSEWDDVISEGDESKLQPRSRFFDSHVNQLVGGLIAEKLSPLGRVLESMQESLNSMSARRRSSRRETRSISAELPESDADDEDDEELPIRRSVSPKYGRKFDKIKNIVIEALAAHQPLPAPKEFEDSVEISTVVEMLQEMRDQYSQPPASGLRAEDVRSILEDIVEKRMPAAPNPVVDAAAAARADELSAHVYQLEERVERADDKAEAEVKARRLAEDRLAEVQQLLVERVARADENVEAQIVARRAAEDRLAEVQRLLSISSEEEVRLREAVHEKDQQMKKDEETRNQVAMKTTLLEASHASSQMTATDLSKRVKTLEGELREARHRADKFHSDAERAFEAAKRRGDEIEHVNVLNRELRKTLDRLRVQTEESTRVREGMRGKFNDLQEDMARAARDIAEENARRTKKEQELIARQEVLEARLQAEARTRERLEQEIDRLERGEREGMRAVNECKRLENVVLELRVESEEAQKLATRYQREFEEARESGLSEVQRTKNYLQAEVDTANNQVNFVRDDLEGQIMRLRLELDQVRLDADTVKAKNEMLLEESTENAKKALDDIVRKHEREVDDMQAQHERQLSNTVEDAQRAEQNLLERLSLSSAKTDHLQDRISHLEEKLEITKSAAHAAAQAARSANVTSPMPTEKTVSVSAPALPEKISPQALRESIMVLQEQLQDRELAIEKLEQQLTNVDPDAATKISKRDDEITWLRELLAVRLGDLQDIITALSAPEFDAEAVKDAVIRLRAGLQMEEQERERAMNGASAINLPNLAASLKDVAASPRVAQAVGPLAAAWGNWRKGRAENYNSLGEVIASGSSSTPSKAGSSGFLSGLLTPPTSSVRQSTNGATATSSSSQPTAFSSTGRRFTPQQLANRPVRPGSVTPRRSDKLPMRGSPMRSTSRSGSVNPLGKDNVAPQTPPMMSRGEYDDDAQEEGYSDAGFYDDDESTMGGEGLGLILGEGFGRVGTAL
jgi:hypothetical protein